MSFCQDCRKVGCPLRKAEISIFDCVLRQTRATLYCHFGSGLDGYGFEQLVIRATLCSITPGIKAAAAKASAKLVSLCQTLMCFPVLLNPAQTAELKHGHLGRVWES